MCFMAGANAVFTGEQMLTTPCESSLLVCLDVSDPSTKVLLGMRCDWATVCEGVY